MVVVVKKGVDSIFPPIPMILVIKMLALPLWVTQAEDVLDSTEPEPTRAKVADTAVPRGEAVAVHGVPMDPCQRPLPAGLQELRDTAHRCSSGHCKCARLPSALTELANFQSAYALQLFAACI